MPPPYFSEERLPPYEEATKEVVLHTLARDGHRILHLPSPRLDGFFRSLDDPTGTIAAFGHDFLLMRGSIGTASNVSKIELKRLEQSVVRLRNCERALQQADAGGILHRLWVNVMAHGYEASSRPPAESGYFNSPVVLDTGASSGLTPYRGDFISYRKVNIPLRDVSKINHVIGVGTVAWRFKDKHGNVKIVHCQAYHLPTADIRLFSPQNYYQQEYNKANGGEGFGRIGTWDLTLTFAEGERLVFPYDRRSNLPLAQNVVVEEPALRVLHSEPFVHELTKPRLLTSVIEETNQNLTAAQKELLLKHWIYGHAMMRRIHK